MTDVQIHHALAQQAGRSREQAQQAPRPARVQLIVRTQGVGETRLLGRRAVSFGALLMDEPSFSWGVQAGQPIANQTLPMCTAIVLKYIVTSNGLYTGAEMGFRVDSEDPKIRLKFSLTFESSTLRSSAGIGTSGTGAASNTVFR